MTKTVLYESDRLAVVNEDGWQYVQRKNATGVVIMVAVTGEGELVLVEQHRIPVHARVLELPAGIVGDVDAEETQEEAAKRELLEETGYAAGRITPLFTGSVSPGLVGEVMSFYLMQALVREHDGGGVDDEDITVHRVRLEEAEDFFRRFEAGGGMVDCKTYIGLHIARSSLRRD